jgi:hypothetical protein
VALRTSWTPTRHRGLAWIIRVREQRAVPTRGGLADLHVMLAQTVMSDDAGLDARTRQMDELTRQGRYPSGSYLREG